MPQCVKKVQTVPSAIRSLKVTLCVLGTCNCPYQKLMSVDKNNKISLCRIGIKKHIGISGGSCEGRGGELESSRIPTSEFATAATTEAYRKIVNNAEECLEDGFEASRVEEPELEPCILTHTPNTKANLKAASCGNPSTLTRKRPRRLCGRGSASCVEGNAIRSKSGLRGGVCCCDRVQGLLQRVGTVFKQADNGVSGSSGGCGVSGSISPKGMLDIFAATGLYGRSITDLGAGNGRVLMAAGVYGASNGWGCELGVNRGNFYIYDAALSKMADDAVLRDCKILFDLKGALVAADIKKVAYLE